MTVLAGKVAGGVWDRARPGSWPLLSVAVGSTQETVATLEPASGETVLEVGQLEMTGADLSSSAVWMEKAKKMKNEMKKLRMKKARRVKKVRRMQK